MMTKTPQLSLNLPTVADVPGKNRSSQNRLKNEVFPTLELPTKTILNKLSGTVGILLSSLNQEQTVYNSVHLKSEISCLFQFARFERQPEDKKNGGYVSFLLNGLKKVRPNIFFLL